MDTLALVQFGGFQDPEVVPAVVAKGHGLSVEVFLQYFVLSLLLEGVIDVGVGRLVITDVDVLAAFVVLEFGMSLEI